MLWANKLFKCTPSVLGDFRKLKLQWKMCQWNKMQYYDVIFSNIRRLSSRPLSHYSVGTLVKISCGDGLYPLSKECLLTQRKLLVCCRSWREPSSSCKQQQAGACSTWKEKWNRILSTLNRPFNLLRYAWYILCVKNHAWGSTYPGSNSKALPHFCC